MKVVSVFFRLLFVVALFARTEVVSAVGKWVPIGSDAKHASFFNSKVKQVKALQKKEGGMKTWDEKEIDLSSSRNILCLLNEISLVSGISPFGINKKFHENNVYTFFDVFKGVSAKKELDSLLLQCNAWLRNATEVVLRIDKKRDKKLLTLLSVFSPEVHYVFLSNSAKSGLPLTHLDEGYSVLSITVLEQLVKTFNQLLSESLSKADREMISAFLSKLGALELDEVKSKEQKILSMLQDYCDKLLTYVGFLDRNGLREDLVKVGQMPLEETISALNLIKVVLRTPGTSYLSAIRLFEDGEIIRCTLNCFHTELLLAFLLDDSSDACSLSDDIKQVVDKVRQQLASELIFGTYNDMCNVCEPFVKRKFRNKPVYVYSIEEHTGSENRHEEDPHNTIFKIALGTKFGWGIFMQPFRSFLSKVLKQPREELDDFRSVEDFVSYCGSFGDQLMPVKQLVSVLGYINSPRFSSAVGNREKLAPFLRCVSESIRAKDVHNTEGFQRSIAEIQDLVAKRFE